MVLLGLMGVLAARHWDLPWLVNADTLAALGVAVIVVWVSVKLGKKSVDDLLDRIPDDLHDKVARCGRRRAGRRGGHPGPPAAQRLRGLRRRDALGRPCDQLREGATRSPTRAAEAVRSVVPEADVVVHAEPLDREHWT